MHKGFIQGFHISLHNYLNNEILLLKHKNAFNSLSGFFQGISILMFLSKKSLISFIPVLKFSFSGFNVSFNRSDNLYSKLLLIKETFMAKCSFVCKLITSKTLPKVPSAIWRIIFIKISIIKFT